MKKSVYVYTYGCQMNVHDSEKMLGLLSGEGYVAVQKPENADLIIFNTCAIREKAEQKFYSQLGRTRQLKKRNPNLRIAVAGCIAQSAQKGLFNRAPFVDYVLGPQNIHLIGDILLKSRRSAHNDDNREIAHQEFSARRESSVKAWVSIMYGCNNFCSYCIVPYTRGREVSRPSSSVVSEVRDLRDKGYKEATLLGQNVNSYRSDVDFPELLKRLDETKIGRIRFVTSHPRDLSEELVGAIADLGSVCEHVHLPIQSGSDKILSLMNRGYTYKEYLAKTELLRKRVPGIAITADVIVGFPGETDCDYLQTVRAVKEVGFDGIFAFMFSRRKGTKAFDMEGQVSDAIKSERLNALLKIQEDITYKNNKKLEGSHVEVLIEGPSETDRNTMMGRTRTNKIVTVGSSRVEVGAMVEVRVEKARLHSLSGTIVG